MEFKDKVKTRRESLGLTLKEVAEIVGVSAPTIQRYESGEIKNVRRDKIYSLSKALDCSPAYLMDWTTTNTVAKDTIDHFDETLEKAITFIEKSGYKISDGEYSYLLVYKNNKLISVITSGNLVTNYEKINCNGLPLIIDNLLQSSNPEQLLLYKYHFIDDKGKHTVDTVLEMEYNRCSKPPIIKETEKVYLKAARNDNADDPEEQELMNQDFDEL